MKRYFSIFLKFSRDEFKRNLFLKNAIVSRKFKFGFLFF
ncbi:hypothetical protein LEP1GSC013_4482 [Leptospira interrogans serovar Valbuzzi str. Duyster]|nr:hypothetical protein LEP1GSC013_4482 [Leptospira interrogans serovar Valbuzzi str. Duyster]ENO73537.1 hypothetical protein LEP1GSC012_1738 [Leptospira interrogans serovar Valbuzzi str. Valbuzzi]